MKDEKGKTVGTIHACVFLVCQSKLKDLIILKNWILSCWCHFMSPLDAPILHRNMAPKHMAGVSIIQD